MLFSLTACGINLGEIAESVKQSIEENENDGLFNGEENGGTSTDYDQIEKPNEEETEDNIGDNTDADFDADNDNDEQVQTEKTYFSDYHSFTVDINGEYFATPMSISVFDDDEGINILTKYPDVFQPLQMVELDADVFGQRVKMKTFNYYHDETMAGPDTALAYFEFKPQDGVTLEFCGGDGTLNEESTIEDFLQTYGPCDYKNASQTTNLICYRVFGGDMANEKAYLELEFDVETGKLVSFKYGLFDPGYVE